MSARMLPLTLLALLTLSKPAHAAESRLEATYHRAASAGYRIGTRALDAVDASPQQRRAVEDAGARLAASLRPIAQDCEALALDLAQTWTAPTIEPQAVEDLRSDTISVLDAASTPVSTFVVEAGNVLTQAQREALLDEAAAYLRARTR